MNTLTKPTIASLQAERDRLTAELMRVESAILASRRPFMPSKAKLEQALDIVSEIMNVPKETICSRNRQDYVVLARFAWYYVSKFKLGCTYSEIARHIGRDHGAVIKGIRAARNRMETAPSYARTVREIEGRVG